MIPVFFIYGLAFFVIGLAIVIYPKKDSEFKLANNLLLIAGFGDGIYLAFRELF